MLCRMPCSGQRTESSHSSSARAATQRPWRDGVLKLLCVCYMHHVLFFDFAGSKWMSRLTALRTPAPLALLFSRLGACSIAVSSTTVGLTTVCDMSGTSYVPSPSAASWNRSIRSTHAYCERIGRCTGHARARYHTVWCECRIRQSRGSLFFGWRILSAPLRSRLTQNGCLLDPLAKISEFEWFLPAWLSVSGCYLPALSCLARFPPSLVCTCLVARFWPSRVSSFLSGSPLAVSASCLLGCWFCVFLAVAMTALFLNPQLQAAKIKNARTTASHAIKHITIYKHIYLYQ